MRLDSPSMKEIHRSRQQVVLNAFRDPKLPLPQEKRSVDKFLYGLEEPWVIIILTEKHHSSASREGMADNDYIKRTPHQVYQKYP